MSNCDSAREREREKEKERETETVPSTALPNCCETRLKWAFQYLRRDLANPHSVRSIPPTPLLPSFSPSSPFLSLYLISPSWLGLPNIFCIELFQANLRLFALPISSSSATSTEAALLSCCFWRCCLAASFLALAFCRWLLRPFWGCLCFAWLLRVEVGCAQSAHSAYALCMCTYTWSVCVCVYAF